VNCKVQLKPTLQRGEVHKKNVDENKSLTKDLSPPKKTMKGEMEVTDICLN